MSIELLVSRLGGRTSTALREDGDVVELRVEDASEDIGAGDVVKARVTKVLPGIQAAFLDVGDGRDAFLHAADLILPEDAAPADVPDDAADGEDDDDRPRLRPGRRNVLTGPPIQDRLKEGRELIVQVAREALGGKGPRVTSIVSLAGRFLAYAPRVPFRGVSRRIADATERERLREIARGLPPAEGGFIVRTAGAGVAASAFEADAAELVQTWEAIAAAGERVPAPARLHADLGLFCRALRDAPTSGWDTIVVDDDALFREAHAYLGRRDPGFAARVVRHEGDVPLFDAQGINVELEKALRPRVWLRSGGTLIVEPTEALVSIDVNTGKNVGSRRPEETVLKTNLEAAVEIARQLRLRDLGGIIVVDFIDMDRPAHRQQVVDTLTRALQNDRARTKVVGLSELGLLQLTRKRTRASLQRSLMARCSACRGGGWVKDHRTVAHEALLEVRRLVGAFGRSPMTIRAHPEVARELRLAIQTAGPLLDADIVAGLTVRDDEGAAPEGFEVVAR